ncbi:MAG: EcsC family protein [Acidobacteriota bacterium]|nr:EcsC family protein [Acidobacteriota bacterium]
MADPPKRGWFLRRAENALRRGFQRAYETVRVDPQQYLSHLQAAHRLPVSSFQQMDSLPMELLDELAAQTIRAGMKMAAVEGAGFGLAGLVTLLPDLSILAAITLRTVQKLSLIYGFEYNTEEEVAELWVAAASAAGVDIGRELVERQVVNRFVPRVIERIAARASVEVVEKWTARVIPLVSSILGAGLNYYFVRAWGERARNHFRERHLVLRRQRAERALPEGVRLLPRAQREE